MAGAERRIANIMSFDKTSPGGKDHNASGDYRSTKKFLLPQMK